MDIHKDLLYIYIYREKKVFYNIEGQLRGFQGSDQAKTCTHNFCAMFSIAQCTSVPARSS